MAINQRPDTPLAATPDAKIDPPIKRTQSVDPDTGAITYRQSWSGSSKSNAPPSSLHRLSRSSDAPAKSSSFKSATSGSREITSAPIPKAAGAKKEEIKAPLMKAENKFTPTTQKEKVIENKIEDYKKNKSESESFDTYRKRIQERANENAAKAKSTSSKGVMSSSKNKDTSCKTC
jgi:hypothetical protein